MKPALLGLILLGAKKGPGLRVPNLRPALGLCPRPSVLPPALYLYLHWLILFFFNLYKFISKGNSPSTMSVGSQYHLPLTEDSPENEHSGDKP